MKIRIDDIAESGLRLDFSGSEDILSEVLEAVPATSGVVIDPHIKGDLLVVNHGAKVLVTGSVSATVQLQCSRCLTVFSEEKSVNVEVFVAWGNVEAQLQEGQEETDENTIFVHEPVLDVGELIVQEVLLEIPMKPLCNESCPGLCPRCGALKDSPDCTCTREESVNPRWGALARLKKEILS